MSVFSFFSSSERPAKTPRRKKASRLRFEALEDRCVPSGDVAAAVQPQSAALTKTVNFATTPTDFSAQGLLDQFDPALGTLQSIQITHAGSITSQIQVENTSTASTSHISGTVSGNLTLQGPGGLNNRLNLSQYAGSADVAKYDNSIDFQGASGASLGVKTADGTDSITLTGNQLSGYIGSSKVTLTEAGQATSNASGGGNLVAQITSTGQATITVVYNYLKQSGAISGFVYHDRNNDGAFQSTEAPISGVTVALSGTDNLGAAVNQSAVTDATGAYQFTNLAAGNYTLVETQPVTWTDGKTTAGSMGGVATTNRISQIALPQDGQSLNNNFGELKGSSLAGTVYYDIGSNGILDAGDPAIPNTTVTLTGFDANGPVTRTTTTDGAGHYAFNNLLPGTYGVIEAQPAGYGQGTNTLGALGGTMVGDQVANIQLPDATDVTNYNFGEIKPASISGFVFVDPNLNCEKDPGEPGIPGVTVTLTGTDVNGNAVTQTAQTNPFGQFQFLNLPPGTYRIVESQPAGYVQGLSCAGNLGGSATGDIISGIIVPMGSTGIDYHFGEILPTPTGDVAIVKSASTPVSGYGDTLTYTLTISNSGPNDALNVQVTDTFPPDVIVESISAPGWSYQLNSNVMLFVRPSMAAGMSTNIQVGVKVPSYNTSLTNVARVTTTTVDNNPNNNQSQVTTTVQGTPTPPPPPPSNQDALPIQPLQTHALDIAGNPVLGKGQLFTDTASAPADPAIRAMSAFADGVIQTLTGEPADAATLQAAVDKLQGGTSRQEFVYDIWNADTHLRRQVSNVYQTVLNRAPSTAELAAGVQATRGNPISGLTTQLLSSAEFQQLNAGSAALAAKMSQIFLGTSSASSSLIQSLDAQPVGATVQSTMYSPAALNRLVDSTYRQTLRRAATASEIQYWSWQIGSGATTAEGMAQTLLSSAEFYQLAYNSAV